LRSFLGYLSADLGLEIENGVVTSRYGTSRIAVFPIGIDPEKFATQAAKAASHPDVSRATAKPQRRELAIGVDRLDYSKGWSIASTPSTACGRCSRRCSARVPAADRDTVARRDRSLWQSAERARQVISDVNGRHGEVDWTPIRPSQQGYSQTVLRASIALPRSAW